MDLPLGYDAWSMQQLNNSTGQNWQLGPDSMPQPISSASMPSASIPSSSSSMPGYLGVEYSYISSQPQQQQQNLYPTLPNQYSAPSSMPVASGYAPDATMGINASTFQELQAMYPNATPEALMMAVMPQQQQQPMHSHFQHQPPSHHYAPLDTSQVHATQSYQQQYPQFDMQHAASGHSLADALAFSTTSPAISEKTAAAAASPSSITAASTSQPRQKKENKLRQTKLAFLPGIANTVSKEASPPSQSAAPGDIAMSSTSSDVVVVPDNGSEPGTPPLPPARALAANASSHGASAAGSKAATSAPTTDMLLWNRAKPLLGRLAVEQKPETSARELIKILSEFDSDGRFRRPAVTGAELRKTIVINLQSIAILEKGRGYTESGRRKYFSAWMASPAARHILSAWLRQAVPPKKVTEGVADLSRRYKETLIPLLNVLECVPMRKAYLTDEAGLGKAITGASLRAVDTGARKLAEALKVKWTKVIEAEDSTSASQARPAASASGATSTAVKRKPIETSSTAEASTKRYKSATSAAPSSAGVKTPKPVTASTTTAHAKPGLSFFGSSTVKKPVSVNAGGSAKSSASLGSGARSNAGQDVMNFLGTLSGGVAKGAGQAKQEDSSSGAQEKKKVKKRVTWKEDSELVAVKLIEPADYGQDDEQHAAVMERGLEGLEHDEGDALRQSFSTMEEQIDWYQPHEVVVDGAIGGPAGSESVEGPFQLRRNAPLEEVTYAEGQEPPYPDESQLEQEGAISELREEDWPLEGVPEELKGEATLEFGLPEDWIAGEAADDYGADGAHGAHEAAEGRKVGQADAAAAPSNAPGSSSISELLSKIGPLVGGGAGPAPSSQASAAAASAVADLPKLDQNALQSLLEKAKGGGNGADAVRNAAATGTNGTSSNLSSLLSSLSSALKAPPPAAGQGHDTGNNGNYYPASSRPVESYPGEYQQDYTSGGGGGGGGEYYQPQQSSYDYGQASSYAPSSGYGQQGDWDNQQGYGGGSWQSKLHTKPCKFYAKGNCFRGSSCHFRHD